MSYQMESLFGSGEKSDVTQTFFSMGELGGTLRDKDYPALQVASRILGEGFSSRLMAEIRTKMGLVYDVNAAWAAEYNHPGTFQIADPQAKLRRRPIRASLASAELVNSQD
jgi:predicted Zn-dependent peptidase